MNQSALKSPDKQQLCVPCMINKYQTEPLIKNTTRHGSTITKHLGKQRRMLSEMHQEATNTIRKALTGSHSHPPHVTQIILYTLRYRSKVHALLKRAQQMAVHIQFPWLLCNVSEFAGVARLSGIVAKVMGSTRLKYQPIFLIFQFLYHFCLLLATFCSVLI